MTNTRLPEFINQYPEYSLTEKIDEIRARDYCRLDKNGDVYLDFTGGGLYAQSQLNRHMKLLGEGLFGNPHSSNPASMAATGLIEETRKMVLEYFNASDEEYVVIFTSNASGALKLVGESYPFGEGCKYLLTFDNHNSVNGIREYAHTKGAEVLYVPMLPPRMRIDSEKMAEYLGLAKRGCHNLFAFPAQSNFSAVQHPLDWIKQAHQAEWDVLLDAAAYAPTNRLDLSRYKPDFVPISFYKMFGYPTGIGALIARKVVLQKLLRPWFAGGTITVASVQGGRYYFADAPACFEDGTLDYLNIPAIRFGLDQMRELDLDLIHKRVISLTGWMLDNLIDIKHSNGKPLVKIYGPVDTVDRGGAVAMNFFDPEGNVIDHRWIEDLAGRERISIRTGCFCNPGAGELALEISPEELTSCFTRPDHEQRLSYDEFRLCINNKASGAVRVSVGAVSNFSDVERFLSFAAQLKK